MFMSLGKGVTLNMFEGRILAVIDRIGKQRLVGIPYALVMVKNVGLLLVNREVCRWGNRVRGSWYSSVHRMLDMNR